MLSIFQSVLLTNFFNLVWTYFLKKIPIRGSNISGRKERDKPISDDLLNELKKSMGKSIKI